MFKFKVNWKLFWKLTFIMLGIAGLFVGEWLGGIVLIIGGLSLFN